MSESTSLREAIARVIFRGQWQDPESEFAKQKWVKFKELYLADADAVLAVLADLPDEVIEQAAGRFRKLVLKCDCIRCENVAEKHVKNTFAAVFGGDRGE